PTETIEKVDATDAVAGVDDRDEVRRMLDSLAPQQRRVIVLRYFDDLSEAEVAACLGISVGSVKSSCSRGIAALRTNFAPVTGGER
ncbi:MAG: sigma-70 family RNA polymerase sigma factor, partial [Propionibacteriaceae bacterium]|nr:sigma-70 family RNA polymerase sigma factor [Propionibacteriaceae bacterium]